MHFDVSGRLRQARVSRGLSLRSVATAVGVSPSLLSQVETGKTQPSVATLYSLVNLLDVSLDALLRDEEPAPDPANDMQMPSAHRPPSYEQAFRDNTIQRAADNPLIQMQNGVVWERLAVGGSDLADPLIVTYEPGASSVVDERLMRHAGTEFGCILEGELTLKLDFDTFVLHAGDSFSFRSERPHLYVNASAEPVRGVWFVLGRRDSLDDRVSG